MIIFLETVRTEVVTEQFNWNLRPVRKWLLKQLYLWCENLKVTIIWPPIHTESLLLLLLYIEKQHPHQI